MLLLCELSFAQNATSALEEHVPADGINAPLKVGDVIPTNFQTTHPYNISGVDDVVFEKEFYNKYLEYKLAEMTLKDSLTGLYNRQYIDEYLKTTLPLSQREQKKMALLIRQLVSSEE